MQDKLLRTLVLTCLHQAMTSYLARLGPRLTQDKVHRWLAKANKPILLNLRKGNLGFPEQQASCHSTQIVTQLMDYARTVAAVHGRLPQCCAICLHLCCTACVQLCA